MTSFSSTVFILSLCILLLGQQDTLCALIQLLANPAKHRHWQNSDDIDGHTAATWHVVTLVVALLSTL